MRLPAHYEKTYKNIVSMRASTNIDDDLRRLEISCKKLQAVFDKRDDIMSGVIARISADVGMDTASDYKYIAEVVKNYNNNDIDRVIISALGTLDANDISAIVDVDILYSKILAIKKQMYFALDVVEELQKRYKTYVLTYDENEVDEFLKSK